MQQKKIPMRQCLGCREMKPKKELIRVVRSPEGEISLDFRGKANGRGAYVCKCPACVLRMCGRRLLNRAFRMTVPETAYRKLQEDYQNIYG